MGSLKGVAASAEGLSMIVYIYRDEALLISHVLPSKCEAQEWAEHFLGWHGLSRLKTDINKGSIHIFTRG